MLKTSLVIFFAIMVIVQTLLSVPFTFRLIVEIVNAIDLRLNFGIKLPFDWAYVKHGLLNTPNR
jgi:hypothetical protein